MKLIMNLETTHLLEELLKKTACSGVELSSGILQVIFEDRRLVVQSAWRLISNAEIAIASDSEEDKTGIASVLLSNQSVVTASVGTLFNDLKINFGDEVILETFADSEKYENWYFAGGPQEMIVAGPGKLWSCFEAPKT